MSMVFGNWYLGKIGFWDKAIFDFCDFVEANLVVNLGSIDFQLGLPFNINKNGGQNKFGVHISKDVAKMANFWTQNNPRVVGTCPGYVS